jgi:hypothetical protein
LILILTSVPVYWWFKRKKQKVVAIYQ